MGSLFEKSFYVGFVAGVLFGLSPVGVRVNETVISSIEKRLGVESRVEYRVDGDRAYER